MKVIASITLLEYFMYDEEIGHLLSIIRLSYLKHDILVFWILDVNTHNT